MAYSASTGHWATVDYTSEARKYCLESSNCYLLTPGLVGAYWLQYGYTPPYCAAHCYPGPPVPYQNIYTGRWIDGSSAPQASPTNLLDLDSPTLTRPVCPPLRFAQGDPYDYYFLGHVRGPAGRAPNRLRHTGASCWPGVCRACKYDSPARRIQSKTVFISVVTPRC